MATPDSHGLDGRATDALRSSGPDSSDASASIDAWVIRLEATLGGAEAEGRAVVARVEDPLLGAIGRALLAARDGDAASCLRHAEEAHRLGPEVPAALRCRFLASLVDGDEAAAEGWLRRADGIDPGPESAQRLAGFLLEAHRAAEAVPVLERLIARRPDAHVARIGLARARQLAGDSEGAAGALAEAFERAPDARMISSLVDVYADAGRLLGAAALLRVRAERTPRSSPLALLEALAALEVSRLLAPALPPAGTDPEVDGVVRRVVDESAGRELRSRTLAASRLVDAGRVREALLALGEDEPRASGPESARYWYVRGLAAASTGGAERAHAAWERALACDGTLWQAASDSLALALRTATGEAELARALGLHERVDPRARGHSVLQLNLALVLRRAGRREEALHLLETLARDEDAAIAAAAREALAPSSPP